MYLTIVYYPVNILSLSLLYKMKIKTISFYYFSDFLKHIIIPSKNSYKNNKNNSIKEAKVIN